MIWAKYPTDKGNKSNLRSLYMEIILSGTQTTTAMVQEKYNWQPARQPLRELMINI